ncbi:MAG TPA: alkaline phosphatase D family protein [Gaiellaceae bacterium]|nr:alkaline phosphatase D family protein [Gaiellaceae bacterium]
MPNLVLGPLLRHVGSNDATVWVETDAPCSVEVLGHRAPTFHIEGHHYAIVTINGLEPKSAYEYEVALDGERAWPEPGSPFPPSQIRTIGDDHGLRLLFGSCRLSLPHEPPYTLRRDEHELGRGEDALRAYTLRMTEEPSERWPHAIVLLGDQVYADEVSPRTLEFIRSRRDTAEEPGREVADFEEYTRLYWEAWRDPHIRWFLSTVSSAMLFDDHDVHDDWNISHQWVERMRAKRWWDERIVGAFMSYWLYQHLGNLSPQQLRDDRLSDEVAAAEDGGPVLRDFAFRADRETKGRRWSFCRDFGKTRLLAIDCRAGRVLDDENRLMVDDEEWEWIHDTSRGEFDHLLLGMSDPLLLAPAIHDLQAWNNAVCEGAWGHAAVPLAERIREGVDLDHWASFPRALARLTHLLYEVGSGKRGRAPASIVALSGDVHNAYLAEVAFRRGSGVTSRAYQAVCSPIRNPLDAKERRAQRFAATRAAALIGRALRAAAGVPAPDIRWRFLHGPSFANQLATLELDGRRAELRVETPVTDAGGRLRLRAVFEHRLA